VDCNGKPIALSPIPCAEAANPGALAGEAERYLAAVDLFRRLGHEPQWRREDVVVARSPRSTFSA